MPLRTVFANPVTYINKPQAFIRLTIKKTHVFNSAHGNCSGNYYIVTHVCSVPLVAPFNVMKNFSPSGSTCALLTLYSVIRYCIRETFGGDINLVVW